MTPEAFLRDIIVPAASLLPRSDSPEARCMLLAIAGQESGWDLALDPATPDRRGYWRCRKNFDVLPVLTRDRTQQAAYGVCQAVKLWPGLDHVYAAIGVNHVLACCVARLMLALDGWPLPAIGDRGAAYELYRRTWRSAGCAQTWFVRYEAAAGCFERAGAPSAPAAAGASA